MNQYENDIAQIATQLLRGRLGFLFGAGMSIPSGGIPGIELSRQLVCKAFFSSKHEPFDPDFASSLANVSSKYPLEAVAIACTGKFAFGKHELETIVQKAVFPKGARRHQGHVDFAAITNRYGLRTVYTTNWDTLLEEAIGSGSAESITESDLRELDKVYDSGHTAVIHLHGTFAKDLLIGEPDLMNPERPLFQLFLADLLTM